jgi:hypothetical protein
MTDIRRAASIQEIVEALASGRASAGLRKDAAFAIPHIWRRRLPPGVSFNARGRPWEWYRIDRFPLGGMDGSGWPEEELVAALRTECSSSAIQKLAAHRIVHAINLFRLFEQQNKPRKLRVSQWGTFRSVLSIANNYYEHGARDPIGAAMRDYADCDVISIDKVKREYRAGFKENSKSIARFVNDVDALTEGGQSIDAALIVAGEKSFETWTLFELKTLYRHAKKS